MSKTKFYDMAELNTSSGNKKEAPKVDLTAMVDLAFLLITFFMLTTSLAKQNALDIVKPDITEDFVRLDLPASRTMTILLGKQNKLAWYMGEAGQSRPSIEDFKHIRRSILNNQRNVASVNDSKKSSIIVVIKPTSGATYQNFVDIMDELNIAGLTTAPAIDDQHITAAEENFMKENKIL